MRVIPKIARSFTFQMLVWFCLAGNMFVALFRGDKHAAVGWFVAMGFFLVVWLDSRYLSAGDSNVRKD